MKTDTELQGQHFNIRYFNSCVLLDDQWCLDFQFVYEAALSDNYEPIVEALFQSINPLQSAKQWEEARLSDIEQSEKDYQSDRQAEERKRQEQKELRYQQLQFNPAQSEAAPTLGAFDFQWLANSIHWYIDNQQLSIQFSIKACKPKKAIKGKLLSEWSDDGEISFRITVSGIYNNAVPTGTYRLKEGKDQQHLVSLWKDNLDYGLDFNGYLFLQDGWVALVGWLENEYDEISFPVSIYRQFDLNDLDWSLYRFSKAEFETAPVDQVRYLNYEDDKLAVFPEKILQCQQLQELSIKGGKTEWITNRYVSHYAPLSIIPGNLGQLSQLKRLSFLNLQIKELPESLGDLLLLNSIYIHACPIECLPESLFQLTKLKSLSVSRTPLKALPENIHLPNIKYISLTENQLTTLPASLALQPDIHSLHLENNPWEYLPEEYNDLEKINLDLEDKKRLLNYEYQGADGTGLVAWDDAVFFAEHDQALIDPVKDIFQVLNNPIYTETLVSLSKRAIGFAQGDRDDYSTLGSHRFGGYPDFPASITYPANYNGYDKKEYQYEFIAQINLSYIASLQTYLPRTGILYFFLTTQYDISEPCPTRVIWYDGDEPLVSGKNIDFEEGDFYEVPPYAPYKADAFVMNSMPSFYSIDQNPHWFVSDKTKVLKGIDWDDDKDFCMYDNIETPIEELKPHDFAINSYMFTQHESPELQAALDLRGNAEDWIILLKVSSAGDFQWCDAGNLAFVIHKSDLAKGDFSQVFATLESS